MTRVLATCPTMALPGTGSATTVAVPPRTSPEPVPAPVQPPPAGGGANYENCTAVRAAGADPIHRGEPGYSTKLDRDADGLACE